MIGLGLDMCEVRRIERQLSESERFLARYYTEAERAYLDARGAVRPQSAAAMFAAKEAFLKALGVGLSGGATLSEIEIVHDALGAPGYRPTGVALRLMRERGAARALLSVTHEAGVAAAVCVLE